MATVEQDDYVPDVEAVVTPTANRCSDDGGDDAYIGTVDNTSTDEQRTEEAGAGDAPFFWLRDATPDEIAALRAFREHVGLPPDIPDDMVENRELLRFLRARKLKVEHAHAMRQKTLEWRSATKVDGILESPDPNEELFQCLCPHRIHGFDREGHPVYFERTGLVRLHNMLPHVSEEQIVMRHVRHMEYMIRRCLRATARHGRTIERIVTIHDMAGMKYSIETAGYRCFKQTTQIDQDYYPERLHKMLIINAPISFRGAWAMIRPWLDAKTVGKIEILGSKYHQRLAELIPLEELPVEYGGSCKCTFANGDTCIPQQRDFPSPDSPEAWVHE